MNVGELIGDYLEAGCPIIRKRSLKPKSQRTIRGEKYCFHPVREFFGRMPAGRLTLNDCDRYFDWRTSGGYVTTFKVRSKEVTKRTRGGTRAVDLELTVLSNALSLAVRLGRLKTNPLRERGCYTDRSQIRHCRETAPTPDELRQIVEWLENNGHQQPADFAQYLAYSGLRIGEGLGGRWGGSELDRGTDSCKALQKGVDSLGADSAGDEEIAGEHEGAGVR